MKKAKQTLIKILPEVDREMKLAWNNNWIELWDHYDSEEKRRSAKDYSAKFLLHCSFSAVHLSS